MNKQTLLRRLTLTVLLASVLSETGVKGQAQGMSESQNSNSNKKGVNVEESSLNGQDRVNEDDIDIEIDNHQDEFNLAQKIMLKLNEKGNINPKLSLKNLGGGERGLFATEDIRAGEVIGKIHVTDLFVPSKSKLSFEDQLQAIRSKIVYWETTRMVLCIYEEMAKGESSKWADFFKIMPKSYENVGFGLDFNKYSRFLKGTYLKQVLSDTRYYMSQDFNTVKGLGISQLSDLTENRFLEIVCLISSRAIGINIDGKYESILAPFVDLLNHRSDATSDWVFDEESESFYMYTNITQYKGEEVAISYGAEKSNFDLLRAYGFVIQNPQKKSFTFFEGLYETDPMYEAKLDVYPSIKGKFYMYEVDNHYDSHRFFEYLSLLRFKVLDTQEEMDTVLEIKESLGDSPDSVYKLHSISRRNELKMLDYLRKACEKKLGSYDTTLEGDKRALKEGDFIDFIEKNILTVRIEERLMLQEMILFSQSMKFILESGENYGTYLKTAKIDKLLLNY